MFETKKKGVRQCAQRDIYTPWIGHSSHRLSEEAARISASDSRSS